ncbi:hypothetical protein PR003_g6109 [Phytophthora rubi]|uniref:Uncharacterized protein n=1 Tax=Phytophthora rubi TaxID=129364 RepID=A0A6A4FHK1_9STRA|nr:hypothetical protein PR002_g11705 [Phytophthora rubi]KAE9043727.1 hypothetical protein PR001_g5672 [Phytophthora rubi]KAE9349015.1 hypothetical protein PR003_g6109 [Phytophthora rubi]
MIDHFAPCERAVLFSLITVLCRLSDCTTRLMSHINQSKILEKLRLKTCRTSLTA